MKCNLANALRIARAVMLKSGDRVRHIEKGWTGTVQYPVNEDGIVWCWFDDVGQYGADASKLERVSAIAQAADKQGHSA